jgi:undecaprenyl pyrophosphate phosphatase UppP
MQGVAELFPVSSLGHSVLLPAVVGGSWARDLNVRTPESPYLAFIVGLHVATAIALLVYFWRDWVRIVRGLVTSIARREVRTTDQRLAWLLVLATIPVGVAGLMLEHWFRTTLSRPVPTAIFLAVNGVVLLGAEQLRRREGNLDAEYVDERVSGRSPMSGWRNCLPGRRFWSDRRRFSRWHRAYPDRASRWSAVCCAVFRARTPRASRSCSRLRSS